MVLPSDAERRFRRLLSLFSLTSYDPAKATIEPFPHAKSVELPLPAPGGPGEAREKAFDLPGSEDVMEKVENAKLGWHIWTYSPCCY
jgi:hypothetical protein